VLVVGCGHLGGSEAFPGVFGDKILAKVTAVIIIAHYFYKGVGSPMTVISISIGDGFGYLFIRKEVAQMLI
jgi:hypothetical protein